MRPSRSPATPPTEHWRPARRRVRLLAVTVALTVPIGIAVLMTGERPGGRWVRYLTGPTLVPVAVIAEPNGPPASAARAASAAGGASAAVAAAAASSASAAAAVTPASGASAALAASAPASAPAQRR